MRRGGPYTDEEIESAIRVLGEPGRLDEAQRVVETAAPQLQRILNEALEEADWFGPAHAEQLLRAAGVADPDERVAAVGTLLAEETRLAMLVGVAVGIELGQVLDDQRED